MKLNGNTGDVICVIDIPAIVPTDLTFGRCPDSKNGPLSCLYVTTQLFNSTQLNDLRLPTADDGALLMISDFDSEGQLDKKVNLENIVNSS